MAARKLLGNLVFGSPSHFENLLHFEQFLPSTEKLNGGSRILVFSLSDFLEIYQDSPDSLKESTFWTNAV